MKNKYFVFVLFAILVTVSGCYKDKGNYDYTQVPRGDIEDILIPYTIYVNEPVKLSVAFNTSKEELENYTFQWRINGEENAEWQDSTINFVSDKVLTNVPIIFRMTDKRNGLSKYSQSYISVKTPYSSAGWMILSDENEESCVSYLRYDKTKFGPKSSLLIEEATFYKNEFAVQNANQKVGTGPIKLQEHFCHDSKMLGQFWVFQQSGNADYNGTSFKKEFDVSELFTTALPAERKLVDGAFMSFVDVLIDDLGQMYSRIKSTRDLMHSNLFLSTPLKYEGETLSDCQAVRAPFSGSKYTLIYDGNKKRFLILIDGGTADYNENALIDAGKIVTAPSRPTDATAPYEFPPLDDLSGYDVLSIKYYRFGYESNGYVALLKNTVTSALYLFSFDLERSYSGISFHYSNVKFARVEGFSADPKVMCIPPYEASSYAFFADGKRLMMLDRQSPQNGLKQFYTFDSEIVAMDAETYNNRHLAVALANGEFCVLNIVNAKNNTDDTSKLLYRIPESERLGKIKDIKYKVGSGNSWDPS